jgi:hypothetical protein
MTNFSKKFTRNGREYRAEDYGYKAWPFAGTYDRKKKPRKRS